jgi:hypothetical protein
MSGKSITVGLDLGQADYTALVVVERVKVIRGVAEADYWQHPDRYDDQVRVEHRVRAMRRWEPGTTYPAVVADLEAIFGHDPLREDATLVFDRTGVGVAVAHLLADAHRAGGLGPWWPYGLTVTAGRQPGVGTIPKTDLTGGLQLALQQGRVRLPRANPLTPLLERELQRFRLKITASGATTVDIERSAEAGHGDLTSALMLAVARPNPYRHPGFLIDNTTSKETTA